MNKKAGKKLIVLFGVVGMICLFSTEIVSAEEAISTKGVIRLYTEDTTSPSSSTTEPSSATESSITGTKPSVSSITGTKPSVSSDSTKPVGRIGLPSTGELVEYGLWSVGVFSILLALFLLFYRRKQKKEGEEQ